MSERGLVVVPTYNERENLPQIVPRILATDPRLDVLVVDDGSPDGTGGIADELAAADPRVHVLHRTAKEGLGRAYLAGFHWALAREYAWIFEMDADFSHDPKYLLDLLKKVEDADLVLGSRYASGVNVINWPMSRLLLSWFANKYVRWITWLPLTNATGGFKCFRRTVLEAIPLDKVRSNGYAFQIDNHGGTPGDQQWGTDVAGSNGSAFYSANVLTGLANGVYSLEVYSQITTNGVDAANPIKNDNGGANFTATFTITPEPSRAVLSLLGLGLICLRRRRA